MAEIVNLRRAKKAKARAEKSAAAETNRTKHGVAKREHNLAKARADKANRNVDAQKLDDEA